MLGVPSVAWDPAIADLGRERTMFVLENSWPSSDPEMQSVIKCNGEITKCEGSGRTAIDACLWRMHAVGLWLTQFVDR